MTDRMMQDAKDVAASLRNASLQYEDGSCARSSLISGALLIEVFMAKHAAVEGAEPVAWRYRCADVNGNILPKWFYSDDPGTLDLREPLYATPQPAASAPVGVEAIVDRLAADRDYSRGEAVDDLRRALAAAAKGGGK